MKWQAYEELVKDIYQQLGKLAGVRIECWGSSCKVRGKSGVYHNVDVLTSHSDGIHTYKTAIECKHWNEKISKDPVTKLSVILDETNIEKGVLVSKVGFTRDAQQLAKFKNISLVQLREPENSDWEGFIREISIEVNLIVDEIYDYKAICNNIDESHKNSFRSSGIRLLVEGENGNTMSFREIADRVRKSPETGGGDIDKIGFGWTVTSSVNEKVRSYVVKFPDGTVLTHPTSGNKGNISELKFKVSEKVITDEIHIDHKDYVSWIMEVIFEGKRFAISPDRVPTPWQ